MIRTAIVGLGAVAAWHRRALAATAGTTVTAVADTDADRREQCGREWDVPAYGTLSALLAAEPVDWVHVCTPPGTHRDLTLQCIEAGVDALVEKPFALSRAAFKTVMEAADAAGVRVTVVHNQVYYDPIQRACRRVHDGEFGTLHGVAVEWSEDTDPRTPQRGEWVLDLPGGEFGEGIVHSLYVGLRAAGYPSDADTVGVGRVNTTGDERVDYDGICVRYTTADSTVCTIQHHAGVPDRRRLRFSTDRALVTADVGTQSVWVTQGSYGPNAAAEYPAARAGVDRLRTAVRAAVSGVAVSAKRRLVPSYTPHDTHTPVVEREASALRGEGTGPTPRTEADWTNRLLVDINESEG